MTDTASVLEVRINARLRSVQRGDRYEDPLAFWLENHFPGSRVTGGGTLLSGDGEPLSCAVTADITGDADVVLDALVEFLDEIGAPRGSSATLTGGRSRDFGSAEGLALYLNGTELGPEVYADNDVNEFLDDLHASVSPFGTLQAFWEGPKATAVYIYGPSADAIREAMVPLLASHPLAQHSRLEQIA